MRTLLCRRVPSVLFQDYIIRRMATIAIHGGNVRCQLLRFEKGGDIVIAIEEVVGFDFTVPAGICLMNAASDFEIDIIPLDSD